MREKIAFTSRRISVSGCRWPRRTGLGTKVMSTHSRSPNASSRIAWSSRARAASRPSISDFNEFARAPATARWSAGRLPRPLRAAVSQHLAVDADAGHFQTVHELVVGHPLAARRRVDPGDPELAHVTLAGPPVAVGVLERVQQRLVRGAEQRPVGHPEALRQIQDLLVPAARWDAPLYPWHLSPSPSGTGPPGGSGGRPYR